MSDKSPVGSRKEPPSEWKTSCGRRRPSPRIADRLLEGAVAGVCFEDVIAQARARRLGSAEHFRDRRDVAGGVGRPAANTPVATSRESRGPRTIHPPGGYAKSRSADRKRQISVSAASHIGLTTEIRPLAQT
jgi:hypothetical protein